MKKLINSLAALTLLFWAVNLNAMAAQWTLDDEVAGFTSDASYSDNIGQNGMYTSYVSTNGYTSTAGVAPGVTLDISRNKTGINVSDYVDVIFTNRAGSPAGSVYNLVLSSNTENAIFADQDSTASFTNANININNDVLNTGANGIYALGGVSLQGIGANTLFITGHDGYGVYADTAAVTVNGYGQFNLNANRTGVYAANGANVAISNIGALTSNGNEVAFMAQGAGSLISLSHLGANMNNTGYDFVARDNGLISIENASITSQSPVFARLETGGLININNSNITLTGAGNKFFEVHTSTGLTVNYSIIEAGVFMETDGSAVNFTSNNSTLGGAMSGNINAVINNSEWSAASDSEVTGLKLNNSNLYLSHATAGIFNTLTVNGDYIAQNSPNIYMSSALNADGSLTDKLFITGTATGSTTLHFVNRGGTGSYTSGDGIMVVQMLNPSTADFTLAGGKVDSGAYEYLLYKGGRTPGANDNNWFLRSNGKYSDTFKTIVNTPVMAAVMAKTGMNSLEKRLGDLRDFNNPQNRHGAWGRGYMKDLTVSDLIDTDITMYGVEAGYDYMFENEGSDKFFAGVMGGYLYNPDTSTKQDNGFTAEGDGKAPSLGLYATWINEDNTFIDFAVRNFWTDLTMTSYAADGTPIDYNPKRNIVAFSAEAGKTFKRETSGGLFRFEPKAEIMFAAASGKTISASTGINLEYDNTTYFSGKVAVLAAYAVKRASGFIFEPSVELGYSYEFDGKGDVSYGGATYQSDLSGGTFEGALGLNMRFSAHSYIYAQASYESGSVTKGFGANLGYRMGFGGSNKTE